MLRIHLSVFARSVNCRRTGGADNAGNSRKRTKRFIKQLRAYSQGAASAGSFAFAGPLGHPRE